MLDFYEKILRLRWGSLFNVAKKNTVLIFHFPSDYLLNTFIIELKQFDKLKIIIICIKLSTFITNRLRQCQKSLPSLKRSFTSLQTCWPLLTITSRHKNWRKSSNYLSGSRKTILWLKKDSKRSWKIISTPMKKCSSTTKTESRTLKIRNLKRRYKQPSLPKRSENLSPPSSHLWSSLNLLKSLALFMNNREAGWSASSPSQKGFKI